MYACFGRIGKDGEERHACESTGAKLTTGKGLYSLIVGLPNSGSGAKVPTNYVTGTGAARKPRQAPPRVFPTLLRYGTGDHLLHLHLCVCPGGVCRANTISAGRVRRRSAEVALVSARLRGTQGGGVSPPNLPSGRLDHWGSARADLSPACMRGFCGEAAAVLVPLAVASGSDRLAWRATEWGRLPGGRGRGQRPPLGVILVGAPRSEGGGTDAAAHWLPTRPPSTGAAAAMIVLSYG